MKVGVFTAPTSNGSDTVISGLTNPKLILLRTTKQTAAGAEDKHGEMYLGYATYDGGSVQQWYLAHGDEDGAGTSNTGRGAGTGACLKGYSAFTSPTVEFECDLVSMDASSVTLDWVDAPASAILVHYVIFEEGDGVNKALAGTFTGSVAAASQDVPLGSGWGQADFLMFGTHSATAFADAAGARLAIGFAKDGTSRFSTGIWAADGSANMSCSQFCKARAIGSVASVSSFDGEADWDKANDPTDNFRLSWPNQLAAAHVFGFVAIQGDIQTAVTLAAAPTAGSPPVVEDWDVGFDPILAIAAGETLAAHTNVDSTGADVLGWFFGAWDGTTEGLSAITQDDANTTSFAGNVHSETKSVAFYTSPGSAGAPTLQSEADGSFSGTNVRRSWNDIDSVARQYGMVAFGAPASSDLVLELGKVASGEIVRGIDLTQDGPDTLSLGKIASGEVVRGIDLTAAGPLALSLGKVASGEIVRGIDLSAAGPLTLALGKVASGEAVRGIDLTTNPLTLLLGKITSGEAVRGIDLSAAGPLTLALGKIASGGVVRGVDLSLVAATALKLGRVGGSPDFRVDHNADSGWPEYEYKTGGALEDQITLVTSPVRAGLYARRYSVDDDDQYLSTSGVRALGRKLDSDEHLLEGDWRWYAWSTRFSSPWTPPENWALFFEWHADSNFIQAPIKLDASDGLGNAKLTARFNTGEETVVGSTWEYSVRHEILPTLALDVYHDFVIGVLWDRTAGGVFKLWHRLASESDYTLRLDLEGIPTLVWRDILGVPTVGDMGIFQGFYRNVSGGAPYTSVVHHADFRYASTHDALFSASGPRGLGLATYVAPIGVPILRRLEFESGVRVIGYEGGRENVDCEAGVGQAEYESGVRVSEYSEGVKVVEM